MAKESQMKPEQTIAIEKQELNTVAKQSGSNCESWDENNETALDRAVQSGSYSKVKEALKLNPKIRNNSCLKTAVGEHGEDYELIVEALSKFGFTVSPEDVNDCSLFHTAVEKGYRKIVEDLLNLGINVDYEDTETCLTPIYIAVIHNQVEIAELLVQRGARLEEDDLLKYAFEHCDFEIAKILLANGAAIKDDFLISAVTKKRLDMIEVLLQASHIQVNACDIRNQTALHFTALSDDSQSNLELAEILIRNGAEIENKNIDGWTVLQFAVKKGFTALVELLLRKNADVNSSDVRGFTPLHCAAETGNEEITRILLQKKALINPIIDYYHLTPLHIAARAGHMDVVKVLLEHKANVAAQTSSGLTALHDAAHAGHEYIVQILLKYGSDINCIAYDGHTTLHYASMKGFVNIVRILLENGADVGAKTREETTALHFSSAQGWTQLVQLLIEYGANVNDNTYIGETALHYASKGGFEETVALLLQNGADVNKKTETEKSALHFACESGYKRTVGILLRAGAVVNTATSDGRTPLHFACEGDFVNTAKILLKQNADVRKVDESSCQRTALHHASRAGSATIVKMLLKYGACVNIEDEFGRSALLEAAVRGRADICANLLKHGALVNCLDKELNISALHFACNNFHDDIVRCLLEHDVDVNVTNDNDETPLDSAITMFFRTACIGYKSNAEHLIRRITKDVRKHVYVSEQNYIAMFNEKFIDYQLACEKEIRELIEAKIKNTSVSFCDILCSNHKNMANYLKNNFVLQALKSQKYKFKFPMYSDQIELQFQKGSQRKKLMQKAIKMFSYIFIYLPELPRHCIVNILNFLSNQDLNSLIVSP